MVMLRLNGGEFNPQSSTMEQIHDQPISSLILFFTLSLTLFSILFYSLHTMLTKKSKEEPKRTNLLCQNEITDEPDPTHSILLEVFSNGSDLDCEKKKKRKRKKKKKKEEEEEEERENLEKEEELCSYPFTTSSSVIQRKIKQQYDQLIKSHGSSKNGLTFAQMGEFMKCLVGARDDLKHKSEIIHRKFTITKALLLKADRSSFDRLCQQIHKLELEHKRLQEDAFVYNWIQQQLKLSPAYQKMLEIGACMELKAKSIELAESADDDFSDISFEELLAQEKKDCFWQKNGKPRPCSG